MRLYVDNATCLRSARPAAYTRRSQRIHGASRGISKPRETAQRSAAIRASAFNRAGAARDVKMCTSASGECKLLNQNGHVSAYVEATVGVCLKCYPPLCVALRGNTAEYSRRNVTPRGASLRACVCPCVMKTRLLYARVRRRVECARLACRQPQNVTGHAWRNVWWMLICHAPMRAVLPQ